ncbi:MAG: DUF3500 domain-containing protein [Caldilineaceae bacterium SB0668_bin_21]|nr:DUF3500 domain-containing protein [Caldilineaceae bacterium SB0668_bin_21]MYC20576.1 DUF3500 domain-containing protein [Caldilineaceae bacterium SB0662_bin_25]
MNCRLRPELRTVLAFLLLLVILLGGCVSPDPNAESVPTPSAAGAPTTSDETEGSFSASANADTDDQSQTDEQVAAGAGEKELASIVSAALDFIELLDEQQHEAALLPFDSNKRSNWSNLPASMLPFDRNGVRIGDLDQSQFNAMLAFLSTAMSTDGLDTVTAVVAAELILAESSRAARQGLSEGNYWLAFFGTPSPTEPWAWQFGGHHLAVNMSISNGRITMSPTFIGIEPAVFAADAVAHAFQALGGERASDETETVAPFAREIEAALALVNSLSAASHDAVFLSRRPSSLITGAGRDGVIPELEGSQASGWSPAQKQALLDLVFLWVGTLPPQNAAMRMQEIEASLDDTFFAWYGSADGAGAIYYRIQSPVLIIEFLTRGPVDVTNGHYHSIYRDPTNEYGRQ